MMPARELRLNVVQTGPQNATAVLLIHPVGYDLTYWDRQIDALRDTYNVIAYDLPGHGRSEGLPEDITFEQHVSSAASLIRAHANDPIHLVGISAGGMIAQALVLAHPELIRSLTLIGTAPTFSEPARDAMRTRSAALLEGGMSVVLAASLDRWFTPETRARRPHLIDRVTKTILADDPAIHAAMWRMIADFEVLNRLGEIRCPTLVLVGEHDPSTPPAVAALLAERIAFARLVVLPKTSHIAMIESPDAVNVELLDFLSNV